MMEQLWRIYHKDIPEFLREFIETLPLIRLKDVGMNCGCEYTNFPRFRNLQPYSRYNHSVGAALIVWHFTGNIEQTLAALFHDVTTPVFAHVVDFLNGDHLRQESTEVGIEACLAGSEEVCRLLKQFCVRLEDVVDYHRYPIADNDSPALSADRLEYTMGNLLNYGFASLGKINALYEDLTVGVNEAGHPELQFRTPECAAEFTLLALKNSYVYVADEDRFSMELLAGLLRRALQKGVIRNADLQTTESQVIRALLQDAETQKAWEQFYGYSVLQRCESKPETGDWICVAAKKRWIDPLAQGRGRVSSWDATAAAQIAAFQELEFTQWLSALP